ncbi:GntR family transcriptional regulator [Bacillus norwichensis]|uniref:GntR family transcriptional regulator n=1 Tax=Bacillus norwichensis TaxID=2762217 RepID=A0ABR8VMV5_9BACI|nr:GntR family transcriptional regulator [Bacillus norwichensis]MBD8006107.1 GntR family transcriptional regulator [Bacillus norwichensis]
MNTSKGTEQKIKRKFMRDEVYDILLDWIVTGKLIADQQIRDKEISEQLGVSRTPIREALLRLENEGFVQTKANSSTFVTPIKYQEIKDYYSIIYALEKLVIEEIFTKITDQHLEKMKNINQEMHLSIKEGKYLTALQKDTEFHAIPISLSLNAELAKILTNLKHKLKRIEFYYYDKIKDAHTSFMEHEQIIDALKQKDLNLTLNYIEQNWKKGLERIQNHLITNED